MYDKIKLLDIFDETKDDVRDPQRTRRGKLGPAADFGQLPTLGPATNVTSGDRAAKALTPGVIQPYEGPEAPRKTT
jgi:NADH-quinone oxidoreductase subunit I